MRDFGTACNDTNLQAAIGNLDTWGFTGDNDGTWNGTALWSVFKNWQSGVGDSQKSEIGEEPNLYAG